MTADVFISCVTNKYGIYWNINYANTILLTKITATQNEVALSYHKVRGQYFMAVIFIATILVIALNVAFQRVFKNHTTYVRAFEVHGNAFLLALFYYCRTL